LTSLTFLAQILELKLITTAFFKVVIYMIVIVRALCILKIYIEVLSYELNIGV